MSGRVTRISLMNAHFCYRMIANIARCARGLAGLSGVPGAWVAIAAVPVSIGSATITDWVADQEAALAQAFRAVPDSLPVETTLRRLFAHCA